MAWRILPHGFPLICEQIFPLKHWPDGHSYALDILAGNSNGFSGVPPANLSKHSGWMQRAIDCRRARRPCRQFRIRLVLAAPIHSVGHLKEDSASLLRNTANVSKAQMSKKRPLCSRKTEGEPQLHQDRSDCQKNLDTYESVSTNCPCELG